MTAHLEIRTLGPYRLLLNGQPLTQITSRTAEALLLYLVRQKRPVARDVLADFFWDERNTARAAANLRTVLTMLRKQLKDHLHITRHTVAFNHAASYWLDLEELEMGMAALAPRLAQADPLDPETMQKLDAVLGLVAGDFLEGFHLNESRGFEAWVTQIQAQVRRLTEQGLQRLVEACLQQGEFSAGIDHADRLLMLDPYNEAGHRHMLWLLARNGQRTAALAHYEATTHMLEEELGVGPEESTREVYRRLVALPDQIPCRLPAEPTPFVGRAGEAEAIVQRLNQPHCRVLTLLGPGGMGKTRLAMRAAGFLGQQGPGHFLDGIYFVPLATIESPAGFALAVIDALGLTLGGQRSPDEWLRAQLQHKELLLVLDSVELLAPHDAFVQEILALLQDAPGVRLLITSRVRLQIQEEWIYDLGGLDYPAAQDVSQPPAQPRAAADIDYAAGQLFVQEANRLQRHFMPTATDAAAIAHIARLLEGQPLGLELAAASTRTHSCTDIAQAIAHDLDFLAGSLRNVPARQRSLRAVFDFSWGLLSAPEQLAMQRLAVFRGPVELETAARVLGVAPTQVHDLAAHSLVRIHADATTFSIHDTVRQYALRKLEEQPELAESTWQAYCHHYAQFVDTQAPRLHTSDQLEAQELLHTAQSNVSGAWQVAIARGWWDILDAMADGLYWYLWRRSALFEAREYLETAFNAMNTAAEATVPPLTRARIQARLAAAHFWLGDYPQSQALAEPTIPVFEEAEAWIELAWNYDTLGQVGFTQGNYTASKAHYEAALRWFRQAEYQKGVAHTLSALGNVLCDGAADYTRARELYAESLSEYEICGDLAGQTKVTINLGALVHGMGKHAEAVPYYEKGIDLCRQLGHHQTLAIVLNNMGQAKKMLGEVDAAVPLLMESADLRRELGEPRGLAFTLLSLASVAVQQQEPGQVYEYASEALQLGLSLHAPATLADILVSVSGLLAEIEEPVRSVQLAQAILNADVEGEVLNRKVHNILDELRKARPAALHEGIEAAQGLDLNSAARLALDWFKAVVPSTTFPSTTFRSTT